MTETVWVCTACGAAKTDRYEHRDVSCFMNSVECDAASIGLDSDGRVIRANAVTA